MNFDLKLNRTIWTVGQFRNAPSLRYLHLSPDYQKTEFMKIYFTFAKNEY